MKYIAASSIKPGDAVYLDKAGKVTPVYSTRKGSAIRWIGRTFRIKRLAYYQQRTIVGIALSSCKKDETTTVAISGIVQLPYRLL
jgi:hypothetical protein